jgi:hypothetical protein
VFGDDVINLEDEFDADGRPTSLGVRDRCAGRCTEADVASAQGQVRGVGLALVADDIEPEDIDVEP